MDREGPRHFLAVIRMSKEATPQKISYVAENVTKAIGEMENACKSTVNDIHEFEVLELINGGKDYVSVAVKPAAIPRPGVARLVKPVTALVPVLPMPVCPVTPGPPCGAAVVPSEEKEYVPYTLVSDTA